MPRTSKKPSASEDAPDASKPKRSTFQFTYDADNYLLELITKYREELFTRGSAVKTWATVLDEFNRKCNSHIVQTRTINNRFKILKKNMEKKMASKQRAVLELGINENDDLMINLIDYLNTKKSNKDQRNNATMNNMHGMGYSKSSMSELAPQDYSAANISDMDKGDGLSEYDRNVNSHGDFGGVDSTKFNVSTPKSVLPKYTPPESILQAPVDPHTHHPGLRVMPMMVGPNPSGSSKNPVFAPPIPVKSYESSHNFSHPDLEKSDNHDHKRHKPDPTTHGLLEQILESQNQCNNRLSRLETELRNLKSSFLSQPNRRIGKTSSMT